MDDINNNEPNRISSNSRFPVRSSINKDKSLEFRSHYSFSPIFTGPFTTCIHSVLCMLLCKECMQSLLVSTESLDINCCEHFMYISFILHLFQIPETFTQYWLPNCPVKSRPISSSIAVRKTNAISES